MNMPGKRSAGLLAVLCLLTAAGCGKSYEDVANLRNAAAGIVCFGDSITHGYGATRGHDYPALLAQRLGRPVVNAGRDGDTTGSALARLDRDVLQLHPRLVIIELGGNDVLNRVAHEETLKNMESIVRRCVQAGAIVVLVHAKYGLFEDPFYRGYKDIAERYGAVLVADALSGILGNPSRSSGQIHPNDAGYALLAERIAEAVRPLLAAADQARAAA